MGNRTKKVVRCKPTSPGRRHRIEIDRSMLHKGEPEKSLLEPLNKSGGRNNNGRITMRGIGGGHKRRYRRIDFKRDKIGVPGKVIRLEHDPNRSAHIALIHYADGDKRYIIAPKGIAMGATIVSDENAPIKPGNTLPLRNIPLGTQVHCIQLDPNRRAQLVRSAGNSAQVIAREGSYVTLRFRSGEMRKIHAECKATIGVVGNEDHYLARDGKAGKTRHKGKKPKVRGVAMNPVDHPMGGGEGRTSGGRHPVTPWGVPTKGFKTRKNKRTDKFVVQKRSEDK